MDMSLLYIAAAVALLFCLSLVALVIRDRRAENAPVPAPSSPRHRR